MKFSPFHSFWMAGYECADHVNKHGDRVDLLTASHHLSHLERDYDLLSDFEIRTVREGIRWSQVEHSPYQYNWDTVAYMLRKGISRGIQQLWDLCHFGFPDDLTPLHPKFGERFEALCIAFINMYRSIDETSTIFITPVNEVSFLSWLGGEAACTSPFCVNQGWEVKYHLMRAYIRGVAAMKAIDNNIAIISTEPLVHVIPPENADYEQQMGAEKQRNEQFQALDMLCGYICPELGGKSEYLDIVGVNFYYCNQWTHGTTQSLAWAPHDRHESWMPLSSLMHEVYQRYGKPILLTETSHPGEDRGLWIEHISVECKNAIRENIPMLGICIYPIIDRPDWDDLSFWHHSGLWDIADENPAERVIFQPFADALLHAQQCLSRHVAIEVAELAHDLL